MTPPQKLFRLWVKVLTILDINSCSTQVLCDIMYGVLVTCHIFISFLCLWPYIYYILYMYYIYTYILYMYSIYYIYSMCTSILFVIALITDLCGKWTHYSTVVSMKFKVHKSGIVCFWIGVVKENCVFKLKLSVITDEDKKRIQRPIFLMKLKIGKEDWNCMKICDILHWFFF